MTLGVADIERWDPATVRDVAAAATSRADAAAETALALATLPAFALWDGLAAAAAHASMAQTRAELDAHAGEARAVARAATEAAEAIDILKADLRRLEDDAHRAHLEIDRDSTTLVPTAGFRGDPGGLPHPEGSAVRPAGRDHRPRQSGGRRTGAGDLAAEQWAPPRSPSSPAEASAALPAEAIALLGGGTP